MARQAIQINLADMQAIIDVEEKSYNGGLIAFLDHCANIYNEKYSPEKPLYGQLLYLRIAGNQLSTNFRTQGKKKKLSAEHIAKMQAGRNPNVAVETTKGEKITIKNPYKRKEIDEMKQLVDVVNQRAGTSYRLNITYDINARETYGSIYFENGFKGPALFWRELKWYIIGVANSLGVDLYMYRDSA